MVTVVVDFVVIVVDFVVVVVYILVVVIVVIDPRNLPLKFGQIGSLTAEILLTLSLYGGGE